MEQPLSFAQALVIKALLAGPQDTRYLRDYLAEQNIRPDLKNVLMRMVYAGLLVRTKTTTHEPQIYMATNRGFMRYQITINRYEFLVK